MSVGKSSISRMTAAAEKVAAPAKTTQKKRASTSKGTTPLKKNQGGIRVSAPEVPEGTAATPPSSGASSVSGTKRVIADKVKTKIYKSVENAISLGEELPYWLL